MDDTRIHGIEKHRTMPHPECGGSVDDECMAGNQWDTSILGKQGG